jgi:hypothetical protein
MIPNQQRLSGIAWLPLCSAMQCNANRQPATISTTCAAYAACAACRVLHVLRGGTATSWLLYMLHVPSEQAMRPMHRVKKVMQLVPPARCKAVPHHGIHKGPSGAAPLAVTRLVTSTA